ncbi:MAG TPA: hypothetical protein VG253_06060 [Streptosporangiaceae bacterium]|nr:hypothetical protein [Streptosporangiaceae bacterium]
MTVARAPVDGAVQATTVPGSTIHLASVQPGAVSSAAVRDPIAGTAAVRGTAGHGGAVRGGTVHADMAQAVSSAHAVAARHRHHRHHRRRTPRQIARHLLGRFDWTRRQFGYLDRLWGKESGWDQYASNPYSGAYGIPQAVPGNKMSTAGPDWRSSARTQILWGMRYIKGRYVSPRQAWGHECAYGWY